MKRISATGCSPWATSLTAHWARRWLFCSSILLLSCSYLCAATDGWLHWRGPHQNGTSGETNLPQHWQPGGANHLWSIDLPGRGTPVIAQYDDGARVYTWGYRGEGADLVEVLACLDARTGETIWEHTFPDFLSDVIYNRYSIGSPTVDAETGNVYLMTSPGLLMGFDRNGQMIWQRSMMEQFGRLTFPNGRTGAPAIDGDLVIVNTISTNWGREGPGRNRFYAFDKNSGDLVWSSTPGVGPPFLKDSSFCSPVFEWRNSKRVFYAGTGCGNIVCVNAMTGDPIWRFQLALGGVNSSVAIHRSTGGDKVIAIHGKENTDDTRRGRMVAIKLGAEPEEGERGPVKLAGPDEIWRNNDLSMFTSSPVLVGDRVYQVTAKGDLVCVDANTGQILWHEKLSADQLHASPLYADGKLYVPMWHDGLFIVQPGDQGAQVLSNVEVAGACLSSPSVWNGQVYLHTTEKLYCFGRTGDAAPTTQPADEGVANDDTVAARIQVVPAEVLLRPGEAVGFRLRALDRAGRDKGPVQGGTWRKFVPPATKVRAYLDAEFDEQGMLAAGANAKYSAGAFEGDFNGLKGYFRGRILPGPPYSQDFESFELAHTSRRDGAKFAYPPLPWIGARLKWEIRQINGNKVLAKTLDRWLFQRSTVFIGYAGDRNYTIAADVMSDGNRRLMSDVGLINQRYIIVLRGNGQQLEVNSNIERLAVKVPLHWRPKQWHRLMTRVDVADDGSGVVRAKVWPKGSEQPDGWTIEVPVKRAHASGSPGLFGFSPNIKLAVYIDNLNVAPSETRKTEKQKNRK